MFLNKWLSLKKVIKNGKKNTFHSTTLCVFSLNTSLIINFTFVCINVTNRLVVTPPPL